MLPTLNLQFTSLESPDASLPTPAIAPPGADTVPAAGFADLLRLRVDGALGEARANGQLLPQGGSALPVAPDRIAVELIEGLGSELTDGVLPVPTIDQQLLADSAALADGSALLTDGREPRIELRLPVTYPALQAVAVEAPPASDVAPGALPIGVSGAPAATELPAHVGIGRGTPGSVAPPAIGGEDLLQRLPPAPVNAGTRIEASAAESGHPHRLPPVTPQTLVSDGVAVRDEQQPFIDLSRRPDTSPLQGAVTGIEDFSDVFKARPAVVQTVQVLNAQANPQQPQPVLTAAPSATPTGESSYAAAAQQASDTISVAVRNAGWGDQLGERVLLMAGNQVKTAEIRLTPAELGPLRVQVAMDDGAANVTFQAQHAATREAIEQALPRLRELLAENGLSLGQANVGEQGVSERNRDQQPGAAEGAEAGEDLHDARDKSDEPGAARRGALESSLVDTFA